MTGGQSRLFKTTAWSLVRAAQNRAGPEYIDAMNRFIAGYWKPVFYFIRARGCPLQTAEDLTQEFFGMFLVKDWLDPADPERGRFRSFLLKILQRFLADRSPGRARKQVTFDQQLVCISSLMGDDEQSFEPPSTEVPEDIFMRQWARAVIDNVSRRVELWCRNKGRPDWYQIFMADHFPASGAKRPSQEALAKQFRVTRDQIRHALAQTKQQFGHELQEELSDQLTGDVDIPGEIGELERLLGKK